MGTGLTLLPSLAKDIATWFPELEGRSIAVSDAKISRQNMPTLPLVMVSFAHELVGATATASVNLSQRGEFEVIDEFVVEFWLKPSRIVKDNSVETPFWSFYDYEAI